MFYILHILSGTYYCRVEEDHQWSTYTKHDYYIAFREGKDAYMFKSKTKAKQCLKNNFSKKEQKLFLIVQK